MGQSLVVRCQMSKQSQNEDSLQIDDSAEVPLILRDNERLPVMIEEEQELPFALPLHVIATADFFI